MEIGIYQVSPKWAILWLILFFFRISTRAKPPCKLERNKTIVYVVPSGKWERIYVPRELWIQSTIPEEKMT